tara:strand:+ start:7358 stop:7918 length:561 start_codon:yes stop_codon:yes gene_type:complete
MIFSFIIAFFIDEKLERKKTYLLIILVYWILFFVSKKLKILEIKFKSLHYSEFLKSFLISCGILLIYIFEIKILNPKIGYFEFYYPKYDFFDFSYYVLIAPFLEEIFTKSIIMQNLLKEKLNIYGIIFIISIYFTIFHYPSILLIHLTMGIINSFLYYKNQNVMQCVLIHAFYNLLSFLLFTIFKI